METTEQTNLQFLRHMVTTLAALCTDEDLLDLIAKLLMAEVSG